MTLWRRLLIAAMRLVEYSAADQESAATEVEALAEGAVVVAMLIDYAVLRDQARACR